MAQVIVKINGFPHTVGCEDGQESHLAAMAEAVESRVASIRALGGQSGEARILVLSALLLADELHDLQHEVATLRAARPPAPAAAGIADHRVAETLGRLTDRAEAIAAKLDET